jgi:hypothetical protein
VGTSPVSLLVDKQQIRLACRPSWNAINFDGGGSTALVVQGTDGNPDLLNRPSGGAERYDGANLGIYAAPLQPVPLPPAIALFGSGLLGLLGFSRRKPV